MHDSILGPHKEGDKVVIRAIPYHYIGKIEYVGYHSLTLAPGAVWLADSGRWSKMLESGNPNECEAFPDGVTIPFNVIADVTVWKHPIPNTK